MPDTLQSSHILFYNVENLFDTQDDPMTNDNAFLPASRRKWRVGRYRHKLKQLARVLLSVEEDFPVLVGLAEVENRRVLNDLIVAAGHSEQTVGILHTDSPDERGMDVALLFRKDLFKPILSESLNVMITTGPDDRTRNILYVKGIMGRGEPLHVFINHWPSRRSGTKVSMPRRFDAARTQVARMERILLEDPGARIIAMGDFNCTPADAPVFRLLDQTGSDKGRMINLGWTIHHQKQGSTSYRGKWLLFDQILATPSLLHSTDWPRIVKDSFKVWQHDWMLFYNPVYNDYRPNKTYGGRRYHGGFSDHLPVTCQIENRK